MRVTQQHWEVFLNVAEKYPCLITSKFNGAQGKIEGNALWATLANKLNGLGLGEKSIADWRRAVTDWKSKVKSKASKLRAAHIQTGGGSPETIALSSLEERLINLIGRKCFEGAETVKELGMPPSTTGKKSLFDTNKGHQNVLQEIILNTHAKEDPIEEILENISEEQPSTSEVPATQEHGYSLKRKAETIESENKKRPRKQHKQKISKNIESMTQESLDILKNIEKNTERIATSFEEFVSG